MLSACGRNRVLPARLCTTPANPIVFGEPNNDLDTETLQMLAERLVEFFGSLLAASHDRSFLDSVVTSTFGVEAATAPGTLLAVAADGVRW